MNKKESNFIIHVCTLIGLSFLGQGADTCHGYTI